MTSQDVVFLLLVFIILLTLSFPLGKFMAKLFEGKIPWMERLLKTILKVFMPDKFIPMTPLTYGKQVLIFHGIGFVVIVLILMLQKILPLNYEHMPNVSWHLAVNIATSFITNTNWQSYGGESTLSYFSQMMGLTIQNFLSASVGLSVLLVLIRSLRNPESDQVGNFYEDMLKSTYFLFLPLAFIFAVFLMSQGVIQNFLPYLKVTTLEGLKQVLPMGPVASQEAIKMLGTNGGGFFNANSAHPFENPTGLTNFFQLLSILLIPSSIVIMYGEMIKKPKEALIIFWVMGFLLIGGSVIALWSEYLPNITLGVPLNYEGKEFRFTHGASALWTVFTTAASNGSINALISSQNPITTLVAMFNMMLGEIIFGGVGSGLYGYMLYILLAVFVAGLMVGRTPEYLGKKVESQEMKMVILALLIPNLCILFGTALSLMNPTVLSSLSHRGDLGVHGFSELLYGITSASANNGSAFAGLNANTPFMNVLLSLLMALGRFGVMIPIFVISNSMSVKKIHPQTNGSLQTDRMTFGVLTLMVILIFGGLTFFPGLVIGPILEHMLMI